MSTKEYLVIHTDAGPETSLEDERGGLGDVACQLTTARCVSEDEVIKAASEADAVLTRGAPMTRRVIQSLKNCKIIVRYGVGFDTVDVAAATDCGIIVANVPDFCIEEVSNHAILLMMACAKKLVTLCTTLRSGQWCRDLLEPMVSIHGQTLGLVACGNIARAVAKKAKALDMEVLGYDPYVDRTLTEQSGIGMVDLPQLLRRSDFVSVHLPLTAETRHLLGEEEFKLMKKTAYFINTARGAVVDEQALIKALREGWIAGAGLDVFEKEPVAPDNPLLHMDNVIVTPHSASYSDAAFTLLRTRVGQEAARVLSGRYPMHIVNPEVKSKVKLREWDD